MPAARILYVEDDDDIRDTMTMLLQHEGYHIVAVATAEEGIELLGRSKFDLLLTDYQLPEHDAAWLLATARLRGVLGDTAVIVLSGAHDPKGVEGYRLIQKPVSQEALFEAFDAMMPERRVTPPRAAPSARNAPLRLALYVSGSSPASRKAQRNLAQVLLNIDPALVEVTVHDIGSPGRSWVKAAEEDRVVVTPTLVRHAPLPRIWIAGDLAQIDVVRDAIVPPLLAPR